MHITSQLARNFSLWALSAKKFCNLRFISFFFIGCSASMPSVLLTSILGTWMSTVGISKTTIGAFGLIFIPYTLKFIYAPFIDRLTLPYLTKKLGHSRSWILLAQVVISLMLVGMGQSNPQTGITGMLICGCIISFFSGLYDITAGGYRMSLFASHEHTVACTYMTFGYRIGYLLSGGGVLLLVDILCEDLSICNNFMNWKIGYITAATVSMSCTLSVLCFLPNQEYISHAKAKNILDWIKKCFSDPFENFINTHKRWLLILLFVSTYRSSDASISIMINPFFREIGFSLTTIALIEKTFGFFAILAGGIIGSILCYRLSILKALVIAGILQMCSNFMFIMQYYCGDNETILYHTVGIQNICNGMAGAVFITYLSILCSIQFAATQFALFSALSSLEKTLLSPCAGWIAENFGWIAMFTSSIVIGLIPLVVLFFIEIKTPCSHHIS